METEEAENGVIPLISNLYFARNCVVTQKTICPKLYSFSQKFRSFVFEEIRLG